MHSGVKLKMEQLTMCAWCKRIKAPDGEWIQPEENPNLREYNHGICLECAARFFGCSEKEDPDVD